MFSDKLQKAQRFALADVSVFSDKSVSVLHKKSDHSEFQIIHDKKLYNFIGKDSENWRDDILRLQGELKTMKFDRQRSLKLSGKDRSTMTNIFLVTPIDKIQV